MCPRDSHPVNLDPTKPGAPHARDADAYHEHDDLHHDESAGTFSEELTNRGRSQTRSVLWTNEGENVPVNGHLSLLIEEIEWLIDCTRATGMRGLDRLTQICHSFAKRRAAVVLVA